MTSARSLYRLHLGLALFAGGAVLAGVVAAVSRITLGLPSVDQLLAACRQVVPLENGPGSLLLVLLAGVGLAVMLLGVRSLSRQLREQRGFLRSLRRVEEKTIDGVGLTVIDDARPKAFCVGLARPRIYVSTAALTLLTPIELAAVVAHEAHHQLRRDPLRILAARVVADAFFFLPALRRLGERYRELAELAADEAAVNVKGPSALASALLRFGERGARAGPVVGIAPERVDQLLGGAPRWQLSLSVLSGAVVIVAGLLGLVLTAPTLVASESVSLAIVLAESCMVALAVVPVAIGASALWLSRVWIRRQLSSMTGAPVERRPAPDREQVKASGPPPDSGRRWLGPSLALAGVVALIGLLAFGLLSSAPDDTIDQSLADGRPVAAPGFELAILQEGRLPASLARDVDSALADGEVSLDELRGTPVVLNFWASWCVPCREEAPLLARSWQRYGPRGVLFVGLNMQDTTADADQFMRDFDNEYLNVRDPTDATARDWGVTGIPETFFITPGGDVVSHAIGVVSSEQMRAGIGATQTGRAISPLSGGAQRPTR